MSLARAVPLLALLTLAPAAAFAAFPADATDITAHHTDAKAADHTLAAETFKGATPGAGKGGVHPTKIYKLQHDLTVYRVYSSSKGPNARVGGWWAHEDPSHLTKAQYMTNYAICKDWNPDMDRMVKCTLKKGLILGYGPGESVAKGMCANKDEHYPKSTHTQIFLYKPYAEQKDKIDCGDAAKDKHDPLKK